MRGPRRRHRLLPALVLALLAASACDAEWGGAEVGLETPPPATVADTAGAEPADPELPALPEGPLLHAVATRPDGRAVVVPAARMTPPGPAALDLPDDPPDRWWTLFTDSLAAAGTELPLYTTGRRIGTVVLGPPRAPVEEGCPPPVEGRLLLRPGTSPPDVAFAWGRADGSSPPPEPPLRPASTRRLRVFGPILAERLLGEAGVERAFLARRAALRPVAFTGDTAAGMAATYLIADTLAPEPPGPGTSSSLFFLARHDPSDGYVPVWSRTTTYADTAGKDVLSHLDWLPARDGRVEILLRTDARTTRLAAARTEAPGASGEVTWTASRRCRVLEALGTSAAEVAPAPADAPAAGGAGAGPGS